MSFISARALAVPLQGDAAMTAAKTADHKPARSSKMDLNARKD
jgi:hypothetical protein